MAQLSREELIVLVTRIMEADGTEKEIDRMITTLEQNVPHPRVSDLIFFPDEEMTAEQIVSKALDHKPFPL